MATGYVTPESFGAIGDGVTNDAAAVQSALADGREVRLDQTYLCNSTLTVTRSKTKICGNGTLLSGVASAPLLSFRNVKHCSLRDVFLDGNWATNGVAIELRGVLYSQIQAHGDRWSYGVKCVATAAAGASQNTADNDLDVVWENAIRALSFQGDGTYFASNNHVRRLVWNGVTNNVATGVDFQAYADNNYFDHAILTLGFAGSTGVVYNSSSPTTDVQVYENHFPYLIVQSSVAGTTSVKGNRTWQNVGQWPSRVTLRAAGSNPPVVSIGVTSDVQLVNTNDGYGSQITGRLIH